MTRILLTGASGFIGSRLASLLRERGHEVIGTSSGHSSPDLMQCDITDLNSVERVVLETSPDVVIHSAAISSPTHPEVIDYYKVNLIGTKNLLGALHKLGRRVQFLFVSTAGVYGNQPVEVLHEELPPRPVHDYGMSKFCAERWVEQAQSYCDATILRPFNVVGPGQTPNFIFPKLASTFARGDKVVRLGNLDVFRDYIDLDSFCATLASLVDAKGIAGEVINLCSGRATSLREVIEKFQKIAGYQIEIIQAPELIRSNEVWRLIGSREKLDRLLPQPVPVGSVQVMAETMYQHYRKGA